MIQIPHPRYFRQQSTQYAEAVQLVETFCAKMKRRYRHQRDVPMRAIELEMRARGFVEALYELAMSGHLARQYRREITAEFVEDMGERQMEHYVLHIYYFKNAFIRVFSVLDKLGTFANQLLELKTEKVKQRFSYFTVLRRMHETNQHGYLANQLTEYKQHAQEPLHRLRVKRNLEIHAMNSEQTDDLAYANHSFVEKSRVEALDSNLQDLEVACRMVCLSLAEIFRYGIRVIADMHPAE